MKVFEAVANAFVKEGTTAVFGLLGDGQMDWWPTIAKHPSVQMVYVREEGAALAMAEGWAKATGKVGVCSVTHGPGLARTALSLIAASRSRTPIVVYTGRTTFNDEHNSQFLNQERFVTASEAGYIEVMTPAFAEQAVRQAFYRARLESRPYVLCVPDDVVHKQIDSDGDDYQTSASLFAGQQRIRPDLDRLKEAVQIIAASKKPVIVVGRGATSPQAQQAIQQLAERIGALTATTLLAKGTLSEHEFHAGISGTFSTRPVIKLYEEADCVIGIGATLNKHTLQGGYLYPNARTIHINILPHLVLGNDCATDCYLQGDAAISTQEIIALLAQQGVSGEGFRTAAVRTLLRDQYRDPGEFEIAPGTVDPREAARVIDEKLPADVGLVTGSSHNNVITTFHIRKQRALQVCVYSFTGVGQVLANAIGVAVAANGRPIATMEGDGSAMQNIQELETAARMKLKLLYIVMNDQAYGAEYHKLNALGYDGSIAAISTPDLGAVGRAFGCRGRVARSLEDIASGIDEFLAGSGPMVLDVQVSRNVQSLSHRRLRLAQDV